MKRMKRYLMVVLCLLLLPAFVRAEEAQGEDRGNGEPAMECSLEEWAQSHPEELAQGEAGEEIEAPAPMIPDEVEKCVIGTDDRTTVYDPGSYPFCAVSYLEASASCGCSWSGTGFMISRYGLITASHCLVCTKHHVPVDEIDFYFGYESYRNYYYRYVGRFTYWYGTNFPDGYDTTWDYGYVKFHEPVGDKTGWFGIHTSVDSDFYSSAYYYGMGYRNGLLKYDYDRAEKDGPYLLRHYIDLESGNSGGPILLEQPEGYYAVAIHIAERLDKSSNIARRLEENLVREMGNNGLW